MVTRQIHLLCSLISLLLTTCLVPVSIFAQKPGTAMEAYEYVQQKRREAERLWKEPNAQRENVEQAIRILEQALVYTQDPLVVDLARGNLYLHARPVNIFFDLAQAHAILNQRTEALDYLRRVFAAGPSSDIVKLINESKALVKMQQEPVFQEVLAKIEAKRRLWDKTAFGTSYREVLTEDEKIAGLSLFWSEVRYNFANFDLVPQLDWNQLYLAYLPKVRAARNTADYYRVLQEMCAQLHDGHTNVYPPKELEGSFYRRPSIRTELIEGKVLITRVNDEVLLSAGIRSGLEIVSIEGLPVLQYAEKYVTPYVSSSTEQDRNIRVYDYLLLAGPKDQPIQLEVRDEAGKVQKKSVPRSGYGSAEKDKFVPSEFKLLNGNIGYLNLKTFEDESVVKSFDAIFRELSSTDALIIDVRENGGGNSSLGFTLLTYLTDIPFKTSSWKTNAYRAVYRAWGVLPEPTWDSEGVAEWKPNGKKLYAGPVILLTSARTFSAAEDFAVAFDYMKRGKIIGEPTGGSTGQPMLFALPGGGQFRVCAKRDTYPDGKEFVGVGVQPDILVRQTVKGIRANQDEVLDAALTYLRTIRTSN